MDLILKGLNAAQKAAVTSPASILQVLAPPGSGKTKTLTARVAYLLAHHNYLPQNVICCTFTIKAAREMRERLRGLVGRELEQKLILGTFHSICRRYLAAYGHLIGIPRGFGIADADDSLGILRRLQKEMRFGMDARAARNKISHRKARGQTLGQIAQRNGNGSGNSGGKSEEAREFAAIFEAYEAALATSNLLDYDDLLLKCVLLLRRYPACVSNIEALLIDEFQDTNVVQFELMKLLASAKNRITIVGDPDQSIYGFRSAETKNLRDMEEYYPGTVVINLEENYRSSSAVLALAQDVIEQDTDRPSKRLKSTHRYGTLPVLRRLPNPHEEAAWTVKEIQRMIKLTGGLVEYSDIAILLRSAFLSLLIEKALANQGIPYKMVGGQRFFDRVEVRLVLDYLRTICHPDNNSALLSIINIPSRKVGDQTIAELERLAQKHSWSIWICIQNVLKGDAALQKKLSGPAERNLRDFVALIEQGRAKLKTCEPSQAPAVLIDMVIESAKVHEYLRAKYRDDWQERSENVNELAVQAKDVNLETITVEDQLPEIDGLQRAQVDDAQEVLSRFLANVALSTEVESDDGLRIPRVTISTIHSAKGLEWPVIFIPAVYEGSIPHSRAEDTNEERRLMYVAMTRAQALLYMTFPVMQSRGENESILTQFIPERLQHRTAKVGPEFDDKVIRDIATILRRPMPSQEALAKGVTSLSDSESRLDDIWPDDGSRKASGFDNNYQSQYGFPITSFKPGSTLLAPAAGFPTTFQTVGYMTSMNQFSMQVGETDRLQHIEKKPKLVRSSSSSTTQGSLNNFFTKKAPSDTTAVPSKGKENVPPIPELKPAALAQTAPEARDSNLPASIPAEFARHRLGLGFSMNRPVGVAVRVAGVNDQENVANSSKRRYTHFSSSPTKEAFDGDILDEKIGGSSSHSSDSSQIRPQSIGSAAAATTSKPEMQVKYNTTISAFQRHGQNHTFIDQQQQQHQHQHQRTDESLGPQHRFSGNSTSTSTISSISQANKNSIGIRKSLGVRRPMSSWADRMKR